MKKIVYGIIAILLIGFIYWIYSGLNGNPIYKVQAEKDMEIYLAENYKDKDFILGKVYYNMSFGGYTAKVTSKSDSNISFILSWRKGAKVIYDEYIYKYAKDELLSKKFATQITEKLTYLLKNEIQGFNSVDSELYIKKGSYNENESFNKDMAEKITVWTYMKGDKISKEEFTKRCIKARDLISKEGYRVESYSFHYSTSFDGDVKGDGEELYSLTLSKGQLEASLDSILKNNGVNVNDGKGKMIVKDTLYRGAISVFILGIIGAGAVIVVKEKKGSQKR